METDKMKKNTQSNKKLKVLSLLIWLFLIYIYFNWYVTPFIKPYMNMIALNDNLFIRATGFSKYNIYLSAYPPVIYLIALVIAAKDTIDNINNINNNLIIKMHCYLLAGFLIVISLYYAAIHSLIF
ncbi:hypothetical protein ASF86_18400 [Acinetobacter sp. Leaf130]|nr:hypothetical protein ASF86_18400 [Acinetobacter sp. Leaf130]